MIFRWYFIVFALQSIVKFPYIIFSSGLCPSDSYDEGWTDMICDGVTDLVNILINIYNEKDETKKVFLTALFEGVELMFLWIIMLRVFTVGDDLGRFRRFSQRKSAIM